MKTAIIIGAGPAGVSAAYQIASKGGGIKPVILEQSDRTGGISATFEFDGCRIDLGPHRFFSKSERVMKFWQDMLPGGGEGNFLAVERLTRIFFLRKFFDYPVKLNFSTMRNLGFMHLILRYRIHDCPDRRRRVLSGGGTPLPSVLLLMDACSYR